MNFYPGPSKLFPSVEQHLQDAYQSGILSRNHRSAAFSSMLEKCIELLYQKLVIPTDYTIVFCSSATECWEIIVQSFTQEQSLHIYNGAFGKKWKEYTHNISDKTIDFSFPFQEKLSLNSLPNQNSIDLVCLTQNETSNGTQLSNELIGSIQQKYDSSLVAVDATSSMGGIYLDFEKADIWFSSVQKCFGLPSGLAIMALSPKAVQRGKDIGDNLYYNSFTKLYNNAVKHQTTYTPNILGIYLLYRQLEERKEIQYYDQLLKERMESWKEFLKNNSTFSPLESNALSDTVVTIQYKQSLSIVEQAEQEGIILGKGYGEWKESTFRIANFPALNTEEIKTLKLFLTKLS